MTQPFAPGPPTEFARRGWYLDPWDRDQLRYWDGRQWAPRVRPLEPVTIVTVRPGDVFTNAMLTLATCGLWAPVWMLRTGARTRVKRRKQ
jgi:hypothetical protein